MTIPVSWTARDPNEAFFPIELRPLFMETPRGRQPLARHYAVVDVEQENAFAVVTRDYELVTNQAAYGMAAEVMKKAFKTTNMDDMVCLNITMPKTRSFCHIDLIHKTASFQPWEKDKWTAFLRITNSYNRTRRLRFELGFCRWICLNGMIFGSKSIEFSYAHTRGSLGRVDRFVKQLGDIHQLESELTQKLRQLRIYPLYAKDMLALLCRVFGVQVASDVVEKPRRVAALLAMREQVDNLAADYFEKLGNNAYAALNVLTDYASRPAGYIAPEASMHGLQQKAGRWMDDFVVAIKQPGFSRDAYLADFRLSAKVIESLA